MSKVKTKDTMLLALRMLLVLVLIICLILNFNYAQAKKKTKKNTDRNRLKRAKSQQQLSSKPNQMCVSIDDTVRAKHKTCLLRPDTGPCRADILSWYYDGKRHKCFRFFWGGCQGNGNRFSTLQDCLDTCYLNVSMSVAHIPYFCSLAFDFGTCFGQYYRWGWDPLFKTCRRRIYSGCGGNQNNFETKQECMANCLHPPKNTMNRFNQYTTCIPFTIGGELQ